MKLQTHIRLYITALLVILSGFVYSTNYYWIATTTANWNTGSNWSTTSGGAGGSVVPGSGDIANFDAAKVGSCTINASVSVLGLSVTSGYTGTITQGANAISVGTSNASFSGGVFIGGSASINITGTFTISGTAFTSTSGTLFLQNTFTKGSGSYTHNNGTVSFNSTGAQNIPPIDYYNLTSTSTGTRTLSATGTVGVVNAFTPGTNSYTITSSTMNYKGAGAQTITAFNYYNLTSSSTGARTLSGTGSIGVANVFTKGTNSYTITGSTINYNGTGAQTITAFNYYNLTISGVRTTNSVTLSSTGTIGIFYTFINIATFSGTGGFVNALSTIDYNGNVAQTVKSFKYNNLTISNSRGATNVTLDPTGVICIAGSFNTLATFTTGVYVNTTSVVDYNGTGSQTITAFNYNHLIISGSHNGNITLPSTGTIGIARVFNNFATFTTGGFVKTGSTFDYNGTLPERISPFQYENVTSSSTGVRSFATTGTVQIANVLNKGANTFVNMGINGEGFSPLNSKVASNVAACTVIDANTAFVAGDGGVILKTTDGGITWIAQNSTVTSNLRGISFYDSNNGLVIGLSGLILRTTNGGSTWAAVTSGTTQTCSGICYINSSTVLISLGNGTIIKSTNINGATPTFGSAIATGTTNGLYKMYFTDANTGYVVGNLGTVYKTTNAGASWTSSSSGIALTSYLFTSVYFTDALTGYISGFYNNGSSYDAAIYKTTNAGASWSLMYNPNTYLGNIEFVNSTTGYACGGNVANNTGNILMTKDAGVTWTILDIGTYRLGAMKFVSPNTGYISGLNGAIIKITCCSDGGEVEFNSGITPVQVLGTTSNVKCNKLKINKPGGKVTLNIPFEVDKQLTFTTGIIGSSATNFLQFNATANAVIGASNLSYVTGPVKKIGNTLFEFPLGDELLSTGAYHPLTITAPTSITDAYTAEYKAANPISTYGSAVETDVVEDVSTCEYWTLNRNAGTSVVTPYINWNTNSCNIVDFNDLLVAGWDGTKWKSLGNGGGAIYGPRGQIKASSGLNLAALPITIAKPKGASNGPYTLVKRQLDGTYATVNNGKLCFMYHEEYDDIDGKLTFNIYNDKNVIVSSNASVPLLLRPSVKYGDNRYMLNIASCLYTPIGNLGSGFYILEIINEKNEKWYLRFKNTISISGSCSESGTVWTQ